MKIAFVIPAYYPAVIGESLYAQDLASRLTEKGNDIYVFTHISPGLKEHEMIKGVNVTRVPIKSVAGGAFYFSSQYIRSITRNDFDIIHSHHYGYFPATAGFLASKIMNVPHVFGPYYHPPVYGRKRWAMFLVYHATQGLPILRFSNAVLPHTKYEETMLLKIGAKKDTIRILPNMVDTARFTAGRKKESIVLFVSNFIYEKGAHVAFEIADSILRERNDTRFVFIGNPTEPRLSPWINRLKKNKNVKFLRNLSQAELIKWYQKASVLILPSMYEAFSRVIAEAESCGTAVVSTRVGAIPEVVRDSESGFLVNYGEWGKMKGYVNYLLDNPSIAARMGKKGREYIVRNFDTDIIVNKLESIYNEVRR